MNVVSVIVPCYNEEDSIDSFYTAMCKLSESLENSEMELMFIDDGSKDGTYQKLVELGKIDHRVRYISFSRNFGKEAAIFSGLRAVKGDCTVVIDVDSQHPPEKIIEMYHLWQQGYEVIEGIKLDRGKKAWDINLWRVLFMV